LTVAAQVFLIQPHIEDMTLPIQRNEESAGHPVFLKKEVMAGLNNRANDNFRRARRHGNRAP
jgi:hypothetical protein